VKAGLVYHRRSVRPESYVFKHALVCDAAYESLVRSRRRGVHERVANTLCQRFPDIEQNRPEMVALHFEHGGQLMAAAEYWHRAGDRAIKRAAYVEATHQLERGLRLLESLPPSPERARQEIELLTTLGTALFLSKGFAAEDVERIFGRAWELCEQSGEDVSLKVLNGIWSVEINRGDRVRTSELVPRFQRLAARSDDPVNSLVGHATLGAYAFSVGDFAGARDHLALGRQLYGTEAFQGFARQYGFDGGLFVYAYEMSAVWTLGYAEQAEAIRKELQAIADGSRNPYSIAIALAYGEALAYNCGETDAVLERSAQLIALSTEQHLYLWLAAATCGRGGALRQRGEIDEAIALIQQGLVLYRSIGVMSAYSYYLTYLAAAHRDAGQVSEGLAVADEGLALCATLVQRFHESELLRLKGDLLLLQEDCRGAESHFHQALDLAQRQQALSYELRAAICLSRLLRAQGRHHDAHSLLRGVYDRFTEGFDTGDLRKARGLLAELS
jgi:predicted ATPase